MEVEGIEKLWKKKEAILGELKSSKLASIPSLNQDLFADKQELKEKIRTLEQSIRKAADMIMKQDLVNMMRVMRRLDLCDSQDQPLPKGRVACCISAADELLTTELLFTGSLSNLEPAVVAAVLSCLVYKDAKASEQKITKDERLVKPFQTVKEIAERVASVMVECKIPLDREEYLKQFNPEFFEQSGTRSGGSSPLFLVYKDAKASEQKITKDERLVKPFQTVKEIAERVASVMVECKIPLDREEYLKQFNPDLMDLTLRWCQGAKFKEVCELVENIYEGTIIRALRRLDELLSQLVEGAKVIGNEELKEKFEQSQK
eukprot:CAMPEP_0202979498 /NCGR_PEP_ID=MMETSP1396-20130829/85624_1 /ASSEMBLY_ACC=CAM_ASM_000872 /TAXON_ID= /ORGANISM="Pseudokeronopsis sp., Strain Brazil" /LENGTH=317 /DNA_ID=CAMNT_0049718939 /DNA_START=1183 /DNA_END=2134 /DNA_ORIENTATION=-